MGCGIAANSSSDFFIWGFEEPENSLEYGLVAELAEDFKEIYSQSAQLFITTHSPAFTSLRDKGLSCFRVYTKNGNTNTAQIWPRLSDPIQRMELDREMGLHLLQEEFHAQFLEHKRISDHMQRRALELEEEVSKHQLPVLLTEGSSDVIILQTAWAKLNPGVPMPFIVRVADSAEGVSEVCAGGAGSLAKMIESIHPDDNRKAIAVFDNDEQGIKELENLSNFKALNGRGDVRVHVNKLAYAVVLPVPEGREVYARNRALSIEFMFPDHIHILQNDEGKGLELDDAQIQAMIINGRSVPISPQQAAQLQIADLPDASTVRKITGGKSVFANEIVPNLQVEDFTAFEKLFDIVLDILRDCDHQ